MANPALHIDEEFRKLIPPLANDEYQQLEQNLINDGCLHELIVWDGTIIDGHNRYEICQKHGIPFKVKNWHFDSREDAIDWIINNQLGRRNISDIQRSYLRGLQYEREKKKVGTNRFTNDRGEEVSPLQKKTAERLAEQHKVTDRTIYTDAQFVKALDTVSKNVGKDIGQKVLTKEIKATKEDIVRIAKMPAEEQREVFKATGKTIKLKGVGKAASKPGKQESKEKEAEKKSTESADINNPLTINISQFGLIVNKFIHDITPFAYMDERYPNASVDGKKKMLDELSYAEELITKIKKLCKGEL